MHPSLDIVSRTLGVSTVRVDRELQRAIRRSEPDARAVYGLIEGYRMVGRRTGGGEWEVSLEGLPERGPGVTIGRVPRGQTTREAQRVLAILERAGRDSDLDEDEAMELALRELRALREERAQKRADGDLQ